MKTIRSAAVLAATMMAMSVGMATAVSGLVSVDTSPLRDSLHWMTVRTNSIPLHWDWQTNATSARLTITGMNKSMGKDFTSVTTDWLWQVTPSDMPSAEDEDVYTLTLTFYNNGGGVVRILTSQLAVVTGAFGKTPVDPSLTEQPAWHAVERNVVIPYDAGWDQATASATNSLLGIARTNGMTQTHVLSNVSGYFGWEILSTNWGCGTFNLTLTFPDTTANGWEATLVRKNLAFNKPVTFSAPPNYPRCTDPGDTTQLTDGVHSEGYFWTQLETVGWQYTVPVQCVIDLGKVEPICGASWSTAGGVSDVSWPRNLFVLVSEDREVWTYLGDLCDLGMLETPPPGYGQYATFRFTTDRMQGRGRYVCVIARTDIYCFVDEIEVYRGPDAWLSGELPGQQKESLTRFYEELLTLAGVSARWRSDLENIFTQADTLGYGEALADAEATKDLLQEQISIASEGVYNDLETILPYGDLHKRILALNAPVLRAAGLSLPLVWRGNRWDPLTLSVIPPQGSATHHVALDLMRGEVRGEIFNITNPNDEDLDLKVSVNGMPEELHVELREVLVTDTLDRKPIAAALRPLTVNAQGVSDLQVPAGCTRQVWLACNRPDITAGTYAGTILIASTDATFSTNLTLSVKIRNLDFPLQPSLHVGGWDYTQGEGDYYKAPGNLDANLALMREMYVDSPWATSAVFPQGARFDAGGQLLNTNELDFAVWDAWVERWQGARNYCVFFAVSDSFDGEPMGTPRFDAKVGSWLTAWVRHIEQQGLRPEQLVILLFDEPHTQSQEAILLAWATAVRAANLGVTLFVDPSYTDPLEGDPAMYAAHDILCPHTPTLIEQGEPFRAFYQHQREVGKTLWLYSCKGPAKLLDPITYHRAQAWIAFQIGAEGSFYWAFGCGGGIGNSWHAYVQTFGEYSPYFVGPTSVMEGKHSEAIREGVQDYEYLCMLREQAEKVRASGLDAEWLERADALLDQGVAEAVTAVVPSNSLWDVAKDRSAMDDVRIRILDTLEDAPQKIVPTTLFQITDKRK